MNLLMSRTKILCDPGYKKSLLKRLLTENKVIGPPQQTPEKQPPPQQPPPKRQPQNNPPENICCTCEAAYNSLGLDIITWNTVVLKLTNLLSPC